ncbi:Biogenesis of lysosome-related organelles complex 1 subunit 5, partial [Eschrichtius robustus]|nr:Biogenesis of lysosome-related organelles complex 1 subunit 5 [Eschrichtius robustus]
MQLVTGEPEFEARAVGLMHNDHLIASEKQHIMQWEDFMKEQHSKQAEVDEEHRKAMERLKEQYAEMEKGLAKCPAFGELEP